MRYELSDYEWTAIKPMLPSKPRGVRRVNDRRVAQRHLLGSVSGAPLPLRTRELFVHGADDLLPARRKPVSRA
jgi:transposase